MQDFEQISILYETNTTRILRIRRKSDSKVLIAKQLDYSQMSEKSKQQLVSEVNILREMKHPSIVRYYEYIIEKSSQLITIIMEFCEHGDLASLITQAKSEKSQSPGFCEDFIWRVFTQISLALHELHKRKEGLILHRDLKPANIFLDHCDNAKLGDFGFAKILENCKEFATTKAGTLQYMPPELLNENKYSEKSEIWSLGCILFEMCAFSKPFEASNELALALKIRDGKIEQIPAKYSNEIRRVIAWCLSINQKERPNAEDLLNIPEISRRLREKRLRENQSLLKKKEEEISERRKELRVLEENLRKREQNLLEKEQVWKEKAKQRNSVEKGTARFETFCEQNRTLNQKIKIFNSGGKKNYNYDENQIMQQNTEGLRAAFNKRLSDLHKTADSSKNCLQNFKKG